MAGLTELVERAAAPGVVAAIDDPGGGELAVVGRATLDGAPMTRDTVFRIASVTKPVLAAAALVLVQRGTVGLDDDVARWLPPLGSVRVLRDPAGPLDDTVPLARPITVRHLLESSSGMGFVSDFGAPVMELLRERLHQGPPDPDSMPPTDEWVALLDQVPLVHQPGAGWSYNTGYELLGIVLARAAGTTLGEVLAETLFEPLGMADSGFWTASGRLGDEVAAGPDGLCVLDPPAGAYTRPPAFESGAGGLVSTVDDLLRFGRMLRSRGADVLTEESVRAMTTAHVPPQPGNVFMDGAGWGYGGGVDVAAGRPWQVPGRYGWIGGSGTAFYLYPNGRIAVWLSQLQLRGPDDYSAIGEFLTYAASA
ncbi:serine hydrolase [Tsukamurella sp. 8F]|uniref:serine hydrolase domain-containing protein n=1 Tax=unclassified Tsukamurella TaxID=2633480 RepID=UPI0023B894F5|nr:MULTISPECIES: serine hydrolase domain-containing protein [unclassified Tsukamurella]MDF0531723.1 serine hydrolase [Tsukamurella sp. 8J]MDF0588969.1 serine hydrolase [Tsukamurella sp. 8F]